MGKVEVKKTEELAVANEALEGTELAEVTEPEKPVKTAENPVNLSMGIKFKVLKAPLQAVIQKNGANIKVLVSPTDTLANTGMSIGEVINEVKKLMGGSAAEVGNLEGDITNAVSSMSDSGGTFDIKSVVFYIRQAFLYYDKKEDSSDMEYAFSLEVNFEGMMQNIDFINLETISLSLWTTRRSKIIEQMNMFNIDKYLEKFPVG